MLTPERWQRLKVLFEAASHLQGEDRAAFIQSACGADEELGHSLHKLLGQSAISGGILDHPIASLMPATETAAAPQSFSAGQVVDGRFEVVSILGKGGMGEVYQAYDRELGEQVALKTVRCDLSDSGRMLQRLRQEVTRSRRIAHPNVCRVYDFFTHPLGDGPGISFLTMELLAGPTLAQVLRDHGPMGLSEAAPIAEQILLALSAAHEAGIIHRDLKPGNVLLTGFGTLGRRVVVTDFGLAAERHSISAAWRYGPDQSVAGTPSYMAPEQFRGRATVASDIYSFGVLLFEMLTGKTPDQVDSEEAVDDPSSSLSVGALSLLSSIPQNWRDLIVRCLETRPQDRFPTVQELLAALRGNASKRVPTFRLTRRHYLAGVSVAAVSLGSAFELWRYRSGPSGNMSLIVLPFRWAGQSADGALLSDGFTDGLIDSLSRRSRLRVIAHGSAFHYKDRAIDAATLSHELNVTHILSGEIQILGDTARLSATLTKAPKGELIWSREFVRPVNSILVTQSVVAREVVAILNARSPTGRIPEGQELSGADLDVYKLYLKGRFEWNRRTEAGFRRAAEFFREVIGLDPNHDQAYCGLADSYALLAIYAFALPNDVMPQAKVAAERALALNGDLAEAHTSLGLIQAVYDWNWPGARDNLRKAVELNPGYVTGHQWFGYYFAWTGDGKQAREQMEKALTLDPLSLALLHSLGWLAFWNREYKEAEAHFRHAMALNPSFSPVYGPLALSCAQQSRYDEALNTVKTLREMDASPNSLPDLARIYAAAGDRAMALRSLADAERLAANPANSGISLAGAYEALHDPDNAIRWLYAAYEARASQMVFLKVDPRLDGLRGDRRFKDLLSKLHFLN